MKMLFFFFLTLFILVISHEAGHFAVARALGVRVLRFSFGFGRVLLRWRDKHETEYTWSLIPLGGYVKMLDEQIAPVVPEELPYAFNRKPIWARFLIVLAGPFANFLLAWILLSAVLMIGVKVPAVSSIIEQVQLGTPAEKAGLKPGDIILRIDGQPVQHGMQVAEYVKHHPDDTIALTLKRQDLQQTIRLKLSHLSDSKQGQLGVQLKTTTVKPRTMVIYREPFFRAIRLAAEKTYDLIYDSFGFVGRLIHGHLSLEEVSGPVGIAKLAGDSAEYGVAHYLLFIAFISVSLGVLNLLPIPLLDGGHLVHYLFEFVLRRPLSQRVQTGAAYMGFSLIIFLTIIAFKNDLTRLGFLT